MAYINIEKRVLGLLIKEYENQIFQQVSNNDTHIEFLYNEDELIVHSDIDNKLHADFKSNQYDLYIKTARSKFSRIYNIIELTNVSSEFRDNVYFMLLYIKAGIDCYPEWKTVNNVYVMEMLTT